MTAFPELADQDDQGLLGLTGPPRARTPQEAIALGRDMIRNSVFVGSGYCLKTIRTLYAVPALYPDAETAWEEATRKHRTSDPTEIPRGAPVWWVNGGHGHVALSLGEDWCQSTDYQRSGYLGRARISDLASWCGGRLVGWSEDLNGVNVLEKEQRDPWGLEERRDLVRGAWERAKANGAPERRVDGLHRWLVALNNRIEEKA